MWALIEKGRRGIGYRVLTEEIRRFRIISVPNKLPGFTLKIKKNIG